VWAELRCINATVVEVDAIHAFHVSRPAAVADLIKQAAAATAKETQLSRDPAGTFCAAPTTGQRKGCRALVERHFPITVRDGQAVGSGESARRAQCQPWIVRRNGLRYWRSGEGGMRVLPRIPSTRNETSST
jgi:hypothetical protein